MTARDEVLGRVRTALGDAQRGVPVGRAYNGASGERGNVDLLVERLEDYRAVVHRTSPEELATTIGAVLAAARAAVIGLPRGLPQAWCARLPSGLHVIDGDEASAAELEDVDVALTACTLAIAETGTLVLDHGAGQGRRALSLVPDHHVIVLHEEQVVPGVPDAIAALDPRRPMTWISGPSATSDIELNRVEGVHGPRRLEVVVVGHGSGPSRG